MLHSPRPRRALRLLLDTVLPPLCPGCGDDLAGRRWLCGDCRRALRPAPSGRFCLLCRAERRPEGDREAGYRCRDPGHASLRGTAAFWMEPPLDALVHALKYRGRDDLGRPLGRLLAAGTAPVPGALVIAVPLHRARLRERGYNQAALLARRAASEWGAPWLEGMLARDRPTRPQARLREPDRAGNVARAFAVREPAAVRNRTWTLVDDVVTTGSTALAAARALVDAGAKGVVAASLALA